MPLTGRLAHNPPARSMEHRTAVPVLLVVFCVLATSAPVAGMSSRKVGIKGLPPLFVKVSGSNSRLVLRCKSGK